MMSKNIFFPKNIETPLTRQEYQEFFSSQAAVLAGNSQDNTTVTLTCGDEKALSGLTVYLQQSLDFFSQKLVIHLTPTAFENSLLQETIQLISTKGVRTVKLIADQAPTGFAEKLLEAVKKHHITLDIELWEGNELIQEKLDECFSTFQREQRIAAFSQTTQSQTDTAAPKKPKRKRLNPKTKKLDIDTDTDAAIEVQVEIAVEVAVEKANENQHEDPSMPELIDRAEFVRRAQAGAFKVAPSCYAILAGSEHRTWDRWMGNINQAVVRPAHKRQKVGITIPIPGDNRITEGVFNYNYKGLFNYNYSVSRDGSSICFETHEHSKNWSTYSSTNLGLEKAEIKKILEQFFPESQDDNVFSKELSDEQWEAARPGCYPHLYVHYPLYVEDRDEAWKGEHIVDADSLAENNAALEQLKADCPLSFKKPDASLRLFHNPKVSCMTPEACEQLLAYQKKLQYGLDFEHLPAGFDVLEVPVEGKLVGVLNYNERKAQFKRKDPYALQLNHPVVSVEPLAHDLFEQWYLTSTHSVLKEQYAVLKQTFNRQKIAEFKSYLPVMLHLPPNLLTEFGNSAENFIHAAMQYQSHLGSITGVLDTHLLGQFLNPEDNKDLIAQLTQWHLRLKLSVAELNGLLAGYNRYGSPGVAAVLKVWEKACVMTEGEITDDSLLKQLRSHYFPYCTSFSPVLDPSFSVAMNIIQHLTPEERHFWEVLFEQHMATVGYDELLPLVHAFQDFSKQIKEKKLAFNPPCQLTGVKNLQTALSRMLFILNQTNPHDLKGVWAHITALDLQSNGAIRLISDQSTSSSKEQWVLPEMQLTPKQYSETHDYSLYSDIWGKIRTCERPRHGYQALRMKHEDPHSLSNLLSNGLSQALSDRLLWADDFEFAESLQQVMAFSQNPEDLKRNYYRYVSAQEHHLSLDFYQKAAAFLDKNIGDLKIRAGFYALVATATSGFKAGALIHDEEHALELAAELWNRFKEITFPILLPPPLANKIRKSILVNFIKTLVPMAPLPYALQLMAMLPKAFSMGWSTAADIGGYKEGIKQLNSLLSQITRVSEDNAYAFYEGIECVDVTQMTYERYKDYAELASQINLKVHASFTSSLIRLMSSFQLNLKIIEDMSAFQGEHHFNKLVADCLALLTQMERNKTPALTQADLLAFIDYLKKNHATKKPDHITGQLAIDCVQAQFAAYFASDFFKTVNNPGLAPELEERIRLNFVTVEERQLVHNLLLSFPSINDQLQREDTLNHLRRISTRLAPQERIDFLTRLSTLNRSYENTLLELNKLLEAIGNRGKIDEVLFLIDRAQHEPKSVPQLITKMNLYYQHVLPYLYNTPHEHVTIADLQPLTAQLVFNTQENSASFSSSFSEFMKKVEELFLYCPHEKQGILALLQHFIGAADSKPEYKILNFINQLCEAGKFIGASDIIRSLAEHYQDKSLELYALLELLDPPNAWARRSLLSRITMLLNNGRQCPSAEVKRFLDSCTTQAAANGAPVGESLLFTVSEKFFKNPPYPTFEQLNTWHDDCQNLVDYEHQMNTRYQQYNLKPCEREKDNGFKINEALELAARFEGVQFTEEELTLLDQAYHAVQGKEVTDLKEELNKLQGLSAAQRSMHHPQLIALLAELLHRSKGCAGGKGNSYELNTVQYLVVLAFLKSNGHITAQMATGEGKSRTMMMAIACQFASNKTVDFVTSDMQLAQRDYLEYQAFFKLLNAETRLISATSTARAYRLKGIHFSDAANLNLFRNKARSQHQRNLVLDATPTDRTLLLDEADRTNFDISETRFNFSDMPKNNVINNMEWIYPLLVRFFNQSGHKQRERCYTLYEEDIDGCTEAFLEFVQAQPEYKDDMLVQIKAVSSEQLESWQEAAVIALNLKLGRDYALEPNVLIETVHGPKLATEARLIYSNRLSKNSKFSFGVHQCLHAYLNSELQNPKSAAARRCAELMRLAHPEIPEALVTVQPFFIHPEKQIVYSSTSKSFLDEYHEGNVWGITGTSGSLMECEEAALLYGKKASTLQAMEFITVPRKNMLKRRDYPLRLTADLRQRVAAILEYIQEAQKAGRPVLLICEDDTEARVIHDALIALLNTMPPSEAIAVDRWQFIDSASSAYQEQEALAHAGKPGMVTVSTSRLGRGADIKLTHESQSAGGLRVLCSYLPRERDQLQIFGRGGRYGDAGDARIVVDKQQLTQQLQQNPLDSEFFLAHEFFVHSQQALMDRNKQVERLIRNSLSDFRMKITNAFFTYYDDLPPDTAAENKKAVDNWAQFTKQADQLWNQIWPQLDSLIKQPHVNIAQVKVHLACFRQGAQAYWENLRLQLGVNAKNLPQNLADLTLDYRTEHLLRSILPKRRYTQADRTQVYKTYDSALDGRAVIYDELFSDLKAWWRGERRLFANTHAWWAGHGILFADTRALLAGKRPLFANLRAWIAKDKTAKKEQQLHCTTLLEALTHQNPKELKHWLQHQEAVAFLQPQAGDLLLSFKIQLLEAVLNYAHMQLERYDRVTEKDKLSIKTLLKVIKEGSGEEQSLITSVTQVLHPLSTGFFGESLKRDVGKVLKQHQQEQEQGEKGNKKP